MHFYLSVVSLVVLTCFWGLGLAWLITPRRWQVYWPLVVLPVGLALESSVVWVGGWLPVAGTDAYGRAALLLPLVLLVIAGYRAVRSRVTPISRGLGSGTVVLGLAMAVALLAVSPWARGGGRLTTISSGSCDAADYAAGARVLKEFRPQDRGGFIGQRAVAGILQVDNFYDHWRQLNHFTPAALLALNASVLGRPVQELSGVLGAMLLAALVPVTVLVARGVVRMRRLPALALAVIVGVGPIQNYAVYQIALGQLLAATAVGLLFWVGFSLLRTVGKGWAWLGLLVVGFWILVGSYTFFLVVAMAPISGVIGWRLLSRQGRRAIWQAMLVMIPAFLLTGAFGWERLEGFALRWNLHDTVEYGWPIPWLRPDGWFGLVSSSELHPVAIAWGGPIALMLLVAALWPWRRWAKQDTLRAWTVAGMVGPAVAGYVILTVKGSVPGSNASYDAYKLLACFQPVLLVGLLWWWRLLRGWVALLIPLMGVIAMVASGASLRARAQMRPLIVSADLAALQQLEQRADVRSVNILCGEMWPRLWANAFLLRKEQYFSVPTYEGRRPTRLDGEWNLVDSTLLSVRPKAAADFISLPGSFSLVRASAPLRLRIAMGSGWYAQEQEGPNRWHWAGDVAQIELINPTPAPIHADFLLRVKGLHPEGLTIKVAANIVRQVSLDTELQTVDINGLILPSGSSVITLASETPAVSPGAGDGRHLSFALYELVVLESKIP